MSWSTKDSTAKRHLTIFEISMHIAVKDILYRSTVYRSSLTVVPVPSASFQKSLSRSFTEWDGGRLCQPPHYNCIIVVAIIILVDVPSGRISPRLNTNQRLRFLAKKVSAGHSSGAKNTLNLAFSSASRFCSYLACLLSLLRLIVNEKAMFRNHKATHLPACHFTCVAEGVVCCA